MTDFLHHDSVIPKGKNAFAVWYQVWLEIYSQEASLRHPFELIKSEVLSAPVAHHLYEVIKGSDLPTLQQTRLLEGLLAQAKVRKIEYRCSHCAFDTKAMHWYCVNCGERDSFS